MSSDQNHGGPRREDRFGASVGRENGAERQAAGRFPRNPGFEGYADSGEWCPFGYPLIVLGSLVRAAVCDGATGYGHDFRSRMSTRTPHDVRAPTRLDQKVCATPFGEAVWVLAP